MMDEEIVKKRNWISRHKFMDLIGATNLIPGPNSTELAIHLGYERGGLLGLLLAGTAFILPVMAIVLLFAITYVEYGNIPQVGSVLYGSGYVLLAFLEAEFVEKLGLLSNQQLLDAVAVGQFTPGPVFTIATFIGYLLRGIPGAILATIGIFLPSFALVCAPNSIIPKLRSSSLISVMLDGINIASLGLMAVVIWKLGMSSLTDSLTSIIFIVSLFTLIKFKINSAWVIIVGGLVGWLSSLI